MRPQQTTFAEAGFEAYYSKHATSSISPGWIGWYRGRNSVA